jgi:hypothetical protein
MGRWYDGRGVYSRGFPSGYLPLEDIPEGAVYIGPCRCGHGPHAHYRLADGEIVHAARLGYERRVSEIEPKPAHDELENDIERLRSRVQELEDRLKDSMRPAKR